MIEPYTPPKKKPEEELTAVEKYIAKPHAFAKPGTETSKAHKGTRFRPMKYSRPPGRPRKHPRDKRAVTFY